MLSIMTALQIPVAHVPIQGPEKARMFAGTSAAGGTTV